MNGQQAVEAVESGRTVMCERGEYPEVRRALQAAAARWLDAGDHYRAQIALAEVRRHDAEFAPADPSETPT